MGSILKLFTARVKENFEKNSEKLLALLASSGSVNPAYSYEAVTTYQVFTNYYLQFPTKLHNLQIINGKESTVNRALFGSTYPG